MWRVMQDMDTLASWPENKISDGRCTREVTRGARIAGSHESESGGRINKKNGVVNESAAQ